MQNHAAARLLPRVPLLLTVMVLAVAAACSVRSLDATGIDEGEQPAATQPAPPTSGLSSAPVDGEKQVQFRAGTCYDQSTLDLEVEPVPCIQPHRLEVYAVEELPEPETAEIALEMAVDHCVQSFAQHTGHEAGLATVMERFVLAPDDAALAAGDRTGVCYVVFPEPVAQPLDSINPLRAFGSVSLFGLEPGDCLVEFDQSEVVFDLVDCDGPHAAEVFTTEIVTEAELPDRVELDRRVDEICFGSRFEDFIGLPYDQSTIVAYGHRPTAQTWQAGDRLIACILTDGLIHTGSFADSGR